MVFIKKTLFTSIIFVLLSCIPSYAELGRKTASEDGSISAGPYYNPASKSYFELFRMPDQYGFNRWRHARENATKHYFKNTQGRLAVVKDLDTHQFILRNFKGTYFWIGLQYFCDTKTLKWIDNTYVSESDFSAWAYKWSRLNDNCYGRGYMAVSYTTDKSTQGATRWQASGNEKAYRLYLVEYPTGGK